MNKPNGKHKFGVNPVLNAILARFQSKSDRNVAEALDQAKQGQETQIRIEYKPGGVRILLSKPSTWIAFSPEAAEDLAHHLLDFAKLAREPDPEESRILVPGGKP